MSVKNNTGSLDMFSALQKLNYVPILEGVALAADADVEEYHKRLRQFFLHEKRTTDQSSVKVSPLLAAPYLRGALPITDYPLFHFSGGDSLVSARSFIHDSFNDLFSFGEATALEESLEHLIHLLQDKFNNGRGIGDSQHLIKDTFLDLRASDIETDDLKSFHDQCDSLESKLLLKEAQLIGYSKSTVFEILNLNLKNRKSRNRIFVDKLKNAISGLNDLLLLHGKKSDDDTHHFEFAEDLISFDKITNIEVPAISSELPQSRLDRIENCLEILNEGMQSYSGKSNLVFVSKDLVEQYNLEDTLREASLNIAQNRPCTEARSHLQSEVEKFIDVVAALRIAELEISQKYEENLHNAYFEEFNISYLNDDDFQFIRPLIVIENSEALMQHPEDLLALISNHAHVKVMGVNSLDHLNVATDDVDADSYLELASLAIVKRNTFVFQGAPDTPLYLNEAFRLGLEEPFPALWNVLLPNQEEKYINSFVTLRTAIDSRFFPRLVYDVESGNKFGSHFDISNNLQPEHTWPSFSLESDIASRDKGNQYQLTIADFFAQDQNLRGSLEIVPGKYSNDTLMPFHEYLKSSVDAVVARIPFIWMVDEENNLRRGAVSISWVQRCRARLDYWQFIQELSGINNYHVQHALAKEKSEWEVLKQKEIEEIKSSLLSEFEQSRKADLERSIKRMLNALLDSNNGLSALSSQPTETVAIKPVIESLPVQSQTENIQEQPEITEKEIEAAVSSEVWIESDECTSCNDCTEALPSVFKYNDDKQAVVHNAKGGTYAKIVAAAEKCPAACIHPGLPSNPNEPNIEKLIKRAEKFN